MKIKLMFMLASVIPMAAVATCFGEVLPFPNGFHNGGIGACDYCHTRTAAPTSQTKSASFKNSSTAAASPAVAAANEFSRFMLNGSDPSSTCLGCHAAPAGQKQPSGYLISTDRADLLAGNPPVQLSPAGDFGWLLKSYKWSAQENGTNNDSSMGERHGHNIYARQFGYEADTANSIAPGGTFPAQMLFCTSCHDPHGSYRRSADGTISKSGPPVKASGSYVTSPDPDASGSVGAYRMLAGKGYQSASLVGDFAFTADPPSAVTPDSYNRVESFSDTRVAYGSGMSEWCANCHVNSHKKGGGHPIGTLGKLSQTVINTYNRYITSGNLNGSKNTSYSSLVPFEMGTNDYTTLKAAANSDGSNKNGPEIGSNVMCLSCHRAHASGWDYMARWNMKSQVLLHEGQFAGTDNKAPATIAQGRTVSESRKAYYDRPAKAFGTYQKGLCSKCHEKD